MSTVSDISFKGPARELGSIDFQPAGLIPVLPELTGTLRHVVLTTA